MSWPPRCCEVLHFADIEKADRPALCHLYLKLAGYTVAPKERIYCATLLSFIFDGSRYDPLSIKSLFG